MIASSDLKHPLKTQTSFAYLLVCGDEEHEDYSCNASRIWTDVSVRVAIHTNNSQIWWLAAFASTTQSLCLVHKTQGRLERNERLSKIRLLDVWTSPAVCTRQLYEDDIVGHQNPLSRKLTLTLLQRQPPEMWLLMKVLMRSIMRKKRMWPGWAGRFCRHDLRGDSLAGCKHYRTNWNGFEGKTCATSDRLGLHWGGRLRAFLEAERRRIWRKQEERIFVGVMSRLRTIIPRQARTRNLRMWNMRVWIQLRKTNWITTVGCWRSNLYSNKCRSHKPCLYMLGFAPGTVSATPGRRRCALRGWLALTCGQKHTQMSNFSAL